MKSFLADIPKLPEVKVFFAWIQEDVGLHHHRVIRGGAVHGGDDCPEQSDVVVLQGDVPVPTSLSCVDIHL